MSLSVEMKAFFEKVARKNFRLACDVYHVLATGKEISPEEHTKVKQALRLAA